MYIKAYLHLANLSLHTVTAIILHCILVCSYSLLSSDPFHDFNYFSMNIYVSNLSFNVQDEDLRGFFTPYGEVTSAKVINDKATGQSRGFGFVEMSDDTAAKKAIAELNDAAVDGRNIKVMEARPKEERSFRGGGNSGGGGYKKSRW